MIEIIIKTVYGSLFLLAMIIFAIAVMDDLYIGFAETAKDIKHKRKTQAKGERAWNCEGGEIPYSEWGQLRAGEKAYYNIDIKRNAERGLLPICDPELEYNKLLLSKWKQLRVDKTSGIK